MQVFLFSFVFFALAALGLSIGVLAGRSAPRGSCGGLNLPDGTRLDCGNCKNARDGRCKRGSNR